MPEKNADTPAGNKPQNPSTPPKGDKLADTPAGNQGEDIVSLPKSEVERMKARQSELDKRENTLKEREARLARQERKTKKLSKQESVFSFEEPREEETPSPEELALEQEKEFVKVEKGILQLQKGGKYDKLLESDSTLAEILNRNPLAILDENPIDAEDALDKIGDYLNSRLDKLPEKTSKNPEVLPVPEAGPTNPPVGQGEPRKSEEKPKEPKLKSVSDIEKDIHATLMGGQ